MNLYFIVKQVAEQLKGHKPINEKEGYDLLYPFDSSIDYYMSPTIAFTDPRNHEEHRLDYKDDEERLFQLKKINTVIADYNKVAMKNNLNYLPKVPADSKVYSAKELGFTKPSTTIREIPLWAFNVMGRTKRGDGYDTFKFIIIDYRKLYKIRMELNNDPEFIVHLNRLIFSHIQIKRKESEKMGTWDSNNIWYKPNQKFHKWFQLNDVDPVEDSPEHSQKEKTNNSLWAIADDMRQKKKEGEFDSYKEAYEWASKNLYKENCAINYKNLKRAFYKAFREGRVEL